MAFWCVLRYSWRLLIVLAVVLTWLKTIENSTTETQNISMNIVGALLDLLNDFFKNKNNDYLSFLKFYFLIVNKYEKIKYLEIHMNILELIFWYY